MRINDIISSKGTAVITARADQSVRELVRLLTENRIGAVVITDGDVIIGIAGERDVVGAVYRQGAAALDAPISSLMTETVHVCGMSDELAEVAAAMTEMRVRHFPVVVDGRLAAIVSIGDIVKSRIDQLQNEQEQLVNYLQATGPDRV
jgi:CBS domain-containing protein